MSGESVGDRYDTLYRRSGFGDDPRFYRWVLRRVAGEKGARVLDIGCGAGESLVACAELGFAAVGVDISGEALRRAASVAPGTPLVRGDGSRLPFEDGRFSIVLNLGNLEHFLDLPGGIREMRRVLAPGGRAWVLLPNLLYSGVIWRVLRGREGPNHHQPIDRFATREEWQSWLAWGGLSVRRVLPYHRRKWWKRLLPSAYAWHFLYECERGDPNEGPPPPAPLARTEPGIILPPLPEGRIR